MADWNKDEAEGAASSALIILAPLLWPATVTLEDSPPKLGITSFKNWSAVTISFNPRLVEPSGPRKPNWPKVQHIN